jgi:hypothetical protein
MGRPRHRPSSNHWPVSASRERHLASTLAGALDILKIRMVECGGDPDAMSLAWKNEVETDIQKIINGAWMAGNEREVQLKTAYDLMVQELAVYRDALMRAGLAIPGSRLPSEPPSPQSGESGD